MTWNMHSAMQAGVACELHPWSAMDALLTFVMWAVMMVGMMVPSAAPMSLLFAQVSRKAAAQGAAVVPTFVFVSGYVAAWTLFGAVLLAGAGLYQLSPWKNACLAHCRAPASFFAAHWRPGGWGAFRMGLAHGLYCLGCCWILMGLLFFGGVMNLLWVAGLTIFVLVEKIAPRGELLARMAGIAMLVAAGAQLVGALS